MAGSGDGMERRGQGAEMADCGDGREHRKNAMIFASILAPPTKMKDFDRAFKRELGGLGGS